MDLPLSLSMLMSSEVIQSFFEVDIADIKKKMYLFAISLLCITIQDGIMKERSGADYSICYSRRKKTKKYKYKIKENGIK